MLYTEHNKISEGFLYDIGKGRRGNPHHRVCIHTAFCLAGIFRQPFFLQIQQDLHSCRLSHSAYCRRLIALWNN